MKPISTHPLPRAGLELTIVPGPFDTGMAYLDAHGLELATAEQLARCRIAASDVKDEGVLNVDAWTAESYVYTPYRKILITSRDRNPILADISAAVDAHRRFKEYNPDLGPLKQAIKKGAWSLNSWDVKGPDEGSGVKTSLEDALGCGVLILEESDQRLFLPLSVFKDHPAARFLYRDSLPAYALFLESKGIRTVYHSFVPAVTANLMGTSFGRPVWSVGMSRMAEMNGIAPPIVAEHGAVCGIREL